MKVKLFYIHPTNYGNLMMTSAFIHYFHDMVYKKYKITPVYYVDVLDDVELLRVKQSLYDGIDIFRENLFNRKRRGGWGKIEKLVNIPREIKYNCKNYDICVVLGGDCISQYYSTQIFVSDMIKFKAISKKLPFYLLGQTLGPFRGHAIKLVQECLQNSRIYIRDHSCLEYIEKMFYFKHLNESRDLAFLDIPYQDDEQKRKELIKKYTGEMPYITIVASGADRQYTNNIENYITEYNRIIENVIENTDYDILLLAHVIHVSDSNDKRIIDFIVSRIDEAYKPRIHTVNYLIQPYEARILIGNGHATITGRMHAAVSSINMGVIPICMSYSVKFKGVIGDDFGLNEYIYQCRGDELWANGLVSKNVCRMLYNVLLNYEELIDRIHNNLSYIKLISMSQIQAVLEDIQVINYR